jgi:hypothetical protein
MYALYITNKTEETYLRMKWCFELKILQQRQAGETNTSELQMPSLASLSLSLELMLKLLVTAKWQVDNAHYLWNNESCDDATWQIMNANES